MPCEEGGGDWSYIAISQDMLKIANYHWKLGERHGTQYSSENPGRNRPYQHLDSI